MKILNTKTLVAASVLALAFTTGFTCSKNQPSATQPATTPSQEQMAAPTEPAAPAADPNAPAAPAEGTAAPAAPAEDHP